MRALDVTEAISNLLDLMRVRSTAYIAKNLTAPWGVHIDEHTNLARFHFVISGATWIGLPGTQETTKLTKGDIAIIPDGKAHEYFDSEDRTDRQSKNYPTPQTPARFELFDRESEDTHLLCGYFEIAAHTPPALISRLPDLLIGKHQNTSFGKKLGLVVDLLEQELSNPSGGSVVTMNRLTEVLCIHTIQDWFERTLPEDQNLMALSDPKTKLVLDRIHEAPEAHWSVEALARLFGQSRTAFIAQFKLATGMTPMHYVRTWRMKLAQKLLRDTQLSIDEVAFKSGYNDTNAFNRAFRRQTGKSPGAYRRSGAD